MKGSNFYLIIKVFLFLSLIYFNSLSGQEIRGNESLALEYFKEGNYEKALPLFAQLFKNSPNNPKYNYYYGISLLKNNYYETAAKEALLNALVDNAPSNVNFYLGNYFHALGDWGEAMDFYARYKGSSQERKELGFDKYISLCRNKINPFIVNPDREKVVFLDTMKTPAPQPDQKNFPIPETLRSEWFNFQVNTQLTYHKIDDFRSEAAKILFTKAWLASGRNDSLVKVTDSLRKVHEATSDVMTRIALVKRIVDAEQQSYELLRDRDKYFEQARVKESTYWDNAGGNAVAEFVSENASRERAHDSLINADIINAKKKDEEAAKEAAAATAAEKIAAPIPSEMPVEKKNPKPAIATNVIFKVQLGSFLNGRITPAFKTLYNKLSKLHKIDDYVDAKKYKIYTVGSFVSYDDATILKNQLVLEGVKGAFVVAFRDGKKIPVTDVVKKKPVK
jgi:tetratricopeptide (TPR) repeat protein